MPANELYAYAIDGMGNGVVYKNNKVIAKFKNVKDTEDLMKKFQQSINKGGQNA